MLKVNDIVEVKFWHSDDVPDWARAAGIISYAILVEASDPAVIRPMRTGKEYTIPISRLYPAKTLWL